MAQSIYEIFQATVAKRGSAVAAQTKVDGVWRDTTWAELDRSARLVTAGLVKHGVKPKEMVSICSNTCLDWAVIDLGILGAGATTVPIYQSNTPADTAYILNDCGAVVVFVEDETQLKKMRSIRGEVPKVRLVVAMAGSVDAASSWEVSYADFKKHGEEFLKTNLDDVKARTASLTPQDILTIIYTSGTTGKPKGAVLTHDNMIYEAETVHSIGVIRTEDTQYFFLPLAHVFAKVLECTWLLAGHPMAFWEGDMKKIVPNLAEVRPHFMCAVPRIFEKVYAKVLSDVEATPGIKGTLGRWALAEGAKAAKLEQEGKSPNSLAWTLAQKLVYAKLKTRLSASFGGRLRFFVSGGAPLSKDIAYFFKYCGVTILEGYGLTETSAASCVNLPDDPRIGSVGRPIPGTEVKIAGDGEILMRGRSIMRGYFNKAEATAEAIDAEGWFHTGDIGIVDKDGFVRITDRKKDIIVTAGGKNVAPQNLESLLKSASSLISQAVVHGDKRKFLSALITVDEENVAKWAKDRGVGGGYADLTQSKELYGEIENVFKTVNGSLASFESVKKFRVLDHDFTIGDELTPSLKVKRKHVNEKYRALFDGFYAGDSAAD